MAAGPQPAATSAGPPTKIVARSTKCPREDRTSFPTAEERGACGGDARQRARWTTVERRRLAAASREHEVASTLTCTIPLAGVAAGVQFRLVAKSETGRTIGEPFAVRLTPTLSCTRACLAGLTAARWLPRPTARRRKRDAAGVTPCSCLFVRQGTARVSARARS